MIQLGMTIRLVNWIMGCVQFVSFIVLINGAPSHFFQASRGLRQGFPLPPFLFLLIVDIISMLVNNKKLKVELCGLDITTSKFITRLLFIDDALLFMYGKLQDSRNIHYIISQLYFAMGMVINMTKCFIIHNLLSVDLENVVLSIFPYPIKELDDDVKFMCFHMKPNDY